MFCLRKIPSGKGFTLVEMMVTVAILSIIGGSFYLIFQGSLLSSRKGINLAQVYVNTRAALDYLRKDLKNALDPQVFRRGDVFFVGGKTTYQGKEYSYMEFVVPDEEKGRKQIIYCHYKSIYWSGGRKRNLIYRAERDSPSPLLPNYPSPSTPDRGFEPSGPFHSTIPVWGNYELALHITDFRVRFYEGESEYESWGEADTDSKRYRLPTKVEISITAEYGEGKGKGEIKQEMVVYLR